MIILNDKKVTAKTWRHSDASLCDKDKSFITQSMIEKYKKFIKENYIRGLYFINNLFNIIRCSKSTI